LRRDTGRKGIGACGGVVERLRWGLEEADWLRWKRLVLERHIFVPSGK